LPALNSTAPTCCIGCAYLWIVQKSCEINGTIGFQSDSAIGFGGGIDAEGNLISVQVSNGKIAGKAKELIHGFSPLQVDLWSPSFSIAPDGRLLVLQEVNPAVDTAIRIEIGVNWFEDLKRLSPVP